MQPLRFCFRGFELGLQPRASQPISDGLKQIGKPPLGDIQITLQLWSCRLQLRRQAVPFRSELFCKCLHDLGVHHFFSKCLQHSFLKNIAADRCAVVTHATLDVVAGVGLSGIGREGSSTLSANQPARQQVAAAALLPKFLLPRTSVGRRGISVQPCLNYRPDRVINDSVFGNRPDHTFTYRVEPSS